MAKVLFTKLIGGDGAAVTLATDDSANLVLEITYPVAKITGPADQVVDELVGKLETALGSPAWLGDLLAPAEAAIEAEITSLLGL